MPRRGYSSSDRQVGDLNPPPRGDTVGPITIPGAARLHPGDLIRVTGPGTWETVEPADIQPHVPEFLDYLDRLCKVIDATAEATEIQHRPAYAERCLCGGSIEVGHEVNRADLRRMHAQFINRHLGCVTHLDSATVLGVVAETENLGDDE